MASTRKTSKRSGTAQREGRARSGASAVALGTLSIGAVLGAAAAAAYAVLRLGRSGGGSATAAAAGSVGTGEHVPTDLMGDTHPGFEDRAVDAFRPDPTAPIPEGERDAFRPALAGASAPTLVKGQARENERLDAAPS
jgi:hypothetical protein